MAAPGPRSGSETESPPASSPPHPPLNLSPPLQDLYQDDALAHVYAIDHYARSESDPRRMCYIHGLGAGAEQADYVSISLILVPLVRWGPFWGIFSEASVLVSMA